MFGLFSFLAITGTDQGLISPCNINIFRAVSAFTSCSLYCLVLPVRRAYDNQKSPPIMMENFFLFQVHVEALTR